VFKSGQLSAAKRFLMWEIAFRTKQGKAVMPDYQSMALRWADYRPSKTSVLCACLVGIFATLSVGFGWGGWVMGDAAQDQATQAVLGARAELAASVCVHQFLGGTKASAQLASLKNTNPWRRASFVEEGGWVTLPGTEKPVAGAAGLCAQQLMKAKLPLARAAGTSE